jgi:hypothetical protein
VFQGDPSDNSVENLRDVLKQQPDTKLVIIETLDDLLKMDDIKENSAARKAFDRFHSVIADEWTSRVMFLALHHMNKKGDTNNFSGDMLMGATVIRGRTDTKLFVWQVDDNDDRRIVRSDNREGTKLPKTYLVFNPETRLSTLGMTVAEASKKVGKSIQERIESEILTYYAARPNSPNSPNTPETMRLIEGNNAAKKRAFRMLVSSGTLTITGGGGAGTGEHPCLPVSFARGAFSLHCTGCATFCAGNTGG